MKDRLFRPSLKIAVYALAPALAVATLAGCGANASFIQGTESDSTVATLSGKVHGGPNPVTNATVTLYATTTAAYGTGGTVLTSTTTGINGGFTFSNVTCPTGQQAYAVATGGYTGSNSPNTAAVLMAALGPCSSFSNTNTVIWIDEPSTIAAAYALSGFMQVGTTPGVDGIPVNISAPANNNAATPGCSGSGSTLSCSAGGLAHAFLNAANLVNAVGTTSAPPTGLPYSVLPTNAKGAVPQSTINALANSVEACINSSGSSSTPCTNLMSYSTPPAALAGGTPAAPTNTLQALLDLAQYPPTSIYNGGLVQSTIVTNLYNLGSSVGYYSPALASAPPDFTIAINYTGSGSQSFTAPWFVTTDIDDNVYVADGNATQGNATGFSVFSWSPGGTNRWYASDVNGSNAASGGSGGDRLALVTDAVNGYVYAPNDGFVYQLNSSSGAVSQTISASGANIFAGALDMNGNLFVTEGAEGGTANLQELAKGGSSLSTIDVNGAAAPALRDIVFDSAGDIWAGNTNYGLYYAQNTGSLGSLAYANAGTTIAGGGGSRGTEGPMIDTSGNVWFSTDNTFYEVPHGTTTATQILAATTWDAGVIRYATMDGNNKVVFAAAGTNPTYGYLSIWYPTGPTAVSANAEVFPCNVGALTSCGNYYAAVYVMRGAAVDSTGSIWGAAEYGANVVQLLGPGAPTWSQANYAHTGLPQ